eukprot:TRINITY_DN62541_c0_g3_i1.p1 TRINITY_DN62541_c0_g3~~TRINITY_DN62541_c0_g3_i1.p1  ORF type:complete len:116 (+),score=21.14 TRINITY_DN62541_c0_g3_i1:68-415(+)
MGHTWQQKNEPNSESTHSNLDPNHDDGDSATRQELLQQLKELEEEDPDPFDHEPSAENLEIAWEVLKDCVKNCKEDRKNTKREMTKPGMSFVEMCQPAKTMFLQKKAEKQAQMDN